MRLSATITTKILFTIGTCFILTDFVNAKPQGYNENWILPPSRQESRNEFQLSSVWNLLDRLWSFSKEKTLIPDINASDLIKRVGILSTEDENEWVIPPSRTEKDVTEVNFKINNIPNIKASDS